MLTLITAIALNSLTPMDPKSIYDFRMNDIDGHPVSLAKFRGKVLLVVNTASFCGNTPQYEGLESMFESKKKDGLMILGFPANQFNAQEPGSNAEIKTFCTSKYNVTFPMFSKIVVKGDGINPLYTWLIASAPTHDDIDWNFAKFLVDRNGHVVARFKARTKPNDPALVAAIDAALADKS